MIKLLPAALGALTAILITTASAQAPREISYQGILTDDLGTPIADGNYSLTVRLYDAEVGGALLFAEAHPAVAVSKGGFNVLVGGVTPLSLSFDQPLWLSLQVGGDPELSPRVALASSPYALGLSLPLDATANGAAAAFTVRNSSGPALVADGDVQILDGNGSNPIVAIQPLALFGGQIAVMDEESHNVARLEPDANGTGGFFSILRSSTSFGFTVNGNDGTEEPIVSVLGSARSAVFDMSISGDAAVSLPSSCVSSTEMFNEAGAAEVFLNAAVTIGTGVTTITSRSITVPDDGYVVAIAGGYVELGHVNGTDSRAIVGVNDVTGAFASGTVVTGVPSAAPSGNYRSATPWVGIWPVSAGSNTFYLLAQRIGAANGAVLNDPTLLLLYMPTAYGTVTGSLAMEGGGPEGVREGLTQGEIETEKAEAAAFDAARLQREVELLRTQVDALQSRFAADPNLTAAAQK